MPSKKATKPKAKPKAKAKPKQKKAVTIIKDKSVNQKQIVNVNVNTTKEKKTRAKPKPKPKPKPENDFYDLLQYRSTAPQLQISSTQSNTPDIQTIKQMIENHQPTQIQNDLNKIAGTNVRDKWAGRFDQHNYHDYDNLESVSVVDKQSVAVPQMIFDIPSKINKPPKTPSEINSSYDDWETSNTQNKSNELKIKQIYKDFMNNSVISGNSTKSKH